MNGIDNVGRHYDRETSDRSRDWRDNRDSRPQGRVSPPPMGNVNDVASLLAHKPKARRASSPSFVPSPTLGVPENGLPTARNDGATRGAKESSDVPSPTPDLVLFLDIVCDRVLAVQEKKRAERDRAYWEGRRHNTFRDEYGDSPFNVAKESEATAQQEVSSFKGRIKAIDKKLALPFTKVLHQLHGTAAAEQARDSNELATLATLRQECAQLQARLSALEAVNAVTMDKDQPTQERSTQSGGYNDMVIGELQGRLFDLSSKNQELEQKFDKLNLALASECGRSRELHEALKQVSKEQEAQGKTSDTAQELAETVKSQNAQLKFLSSQVASDTENIKQLSSEVATETKARKRMQSQLGDFPKKLETLRIDIATEMSSIHKKITDQGRLEQESKELRGSAAEDLEKFRSSYPSEKALHRAISGLQTLEHRFEQSSVSIGTHEARLTALEAECRTKLESLAECGAPDVNEIPRVISEMATMKKQMDELANRASVTSTVPAVPGSMTLEKLEQVNLSRLQILTRGVEEKLSKLTEAFGSLIGQERQRREHLDEDLRRLDERLSKWKTEMTTSHETFRGELNTLKQSTAKPSEPADSDESLLKKVELQGSALLALIGRIERTDSLATELQKGMEDVSIQIQAVNAWQNRFTTRDLWNGLASEVNQKLSGFANQMLELKMRTDGLEQRGRATGGEPAKRHKGPNGTYAPATMQRNQHVPEP
ncbi:hypothetical protein S7711_06584 [Stachybotrys chartarum IBT 7711]|uniref:Uncharacterized protein n=1 Tax=Stachybotrys chartarum (strain CBS 109288 / IBT 7711) TaxID=1280523 RepID=A0A084AYN7_STACB|nr:hypothetical protein S7711_06584 [Stachybotrys chartarum IBT 7711]KFA78309.1 hypothetical protein S40288_05020 [Stachybotrys chartarum IBT 40288]